MTSGSLTASRLLDPTLPAAWGGLLDALADMEALRANRERPRPEREVAARALHDRLMRDAALLLEPDDAPGGAALRTWFAEAVLLWLRLARTSSAPLVDTVGDHTLRDFPLDLPLDDERGAARIRAALEDAFDWGEGELAAIERSVDHLTSNLTLKNRITRALAELLAEGDRLSPAGRANLMRSFYGPVPWRPGDVNLVMTSTSIFFSIHVVKKTRLGAPDWDERPEEERQAVGAFLGKLAAGNIAETSRFPSFGHFAMGSLDPGLLAALTEALGENPEVVEETLATMVSILSTPNVAQYLVHDAWGHTWQEALHDFEWEYAMLLHLNAPLSAIGAPAFGGPDGPSLASAFVVRDGRTELDEAALLRFAEADLRGRIQVGTSAALAEMFADAMESKYSLRHPEAPLPTSSLVPSTSLKLDLTLIDIRHQFERWTEPYRALAEGDASRQAREALAASLASGLPEAGLSEAVEHAALLMWRAFAPAFDGTLRPEPVAPLTASAPPRLAPDAIRSSVLRRILLQLVLIASDLERMLKTPPGAEPAWLDPSTCPDLFTVAVARFYEHDRRTNFFRLDDAMRAEFRQACARLKTALERRIPS